MMEFQLLDDIDENSKEYFYWQVVNSHGDILARSGKYRSYEEGLASLNYVSVNSFSARVCDLTTDPITIIERKRK